MEKIVDKEEKRKQLREQISIIVNSNVKCGVETYVCVKDDDTCFHIEKMVSMNDLKDKVRIMCLEVLSKEYLDEEVKYSDIADVIDDEKKIYVLEQDEQYKPFDMVNGKLESVPEFKEKNINKVLGFLFKLNVNSKKLFIYQQAYVGSKIEKSKALRIMQKDDVFKIVDKDMLRIDKRGELVIIDNNILIKKVNVLQDYFGFQSFVRNQAKIVISELEDLDIIGNIDKLQECQNEEKLTISKKLMKIKNSPVLEMEKTEIISKIKTISRYKDIIHIENGKIRTKTKKDVNNLLKLLNDDIVKSELTDREYDSTSKILLKKA